jgi:hypothetical protein
MMTLTGTIGKSSSTERVMVPVKVTRLGKLSVTSINRGEQGNERKGIQVL